MYQFLIRWTDFVCLACAEVENCILSYYGDDGNWGTYYKKDCLKTNLATYQKQWFHVQQTGCRQL